MANGSDNKEQDNTANKHGYPEYGQDGQAAFLLLIIENLPFLAFLVEVHDQNQGRRNNGYKDWEHLLHEGYTLDRAFSEINRKLPTASTTHFHQTY